MKGLDLKKLKKVSSDDKSTVFKHDMGHEIKIAHAQLSPKMRKELDKIPLHGQKMADGGEPNPQPNASPDDDDQTQAPVVVNVGAQPAQPQAQQGVPVPAQFVPGVSPAGGVATTGNNPNNPSPEDQEPETPTDEADTQPQAPSMAGQAPQQQPMTAGKMLTEPTSADEALAHLSDQTAKLKNDFDNGIITPKTMHDLWAKNSDGSDRGALGKIGLLFGMLAGGMGSGLTHQPNVVLQAMQKQIDNDLEAQKQSKSNQYNALNLAETHYRDEINSHLTQQQAKLTESQMALAKANLPLLKIKSASELLELQAKQMAMQRAGLLPENSIAGQKARAAATMMSNAIDAHQAQRNQQIAQQIEANGQQAQQVSGQGNAPQGGGYILSPDADAKYKALQFDPTKTAQQKSDIESQYNQAIQAEKALEQIDTIYPKAAGSTTVAGSLANAAEEGIGGIPLIGALGHTIGAGIRDIGGQKEKLNQVYTTQLKGYIGSALAGTNVTPSEISKMAEDYLPKESDSPEVKTAKQQGLKDKIMNLLKTGALDAAGMTRRKQ